MVRNYVRKTDQASWTEESMKGALESVAKKEMSIRQATKTFNVPKS
jgi:hypothetical protein